MYSTRLLIFASILAAAFARCEAAERNTNATVLDPVLVTGEQPGPGLWKVSRGGHVLWILGTLQPLPKDMQWRSQAVEAAISNSQEVIGPSTAKIGFDVFLWEIPGLLHARKLPGDLHLRDVLPPDLYARWSVLKAQYVGHGGPIERRRPRFAAKELYENAIDRLGLTLDHDSWDAIRKIARRHHVPITTNDFTIVIDHSAEQLEAQEHAPIEIDLPCLKATVARLETDLQDMRLRANAWSTGDIDALRRLTYVDQEAACSAVFSSLPNMAEPQRQREMRLAADWIKSAETALGKNATTFAVQPVAELLKPDGVLATLRADGYLIEEPQ